MRGCKRKSNLRIMSLTMAAVLMMSSALGSSITVFAQENGFIEAAGASVQAAAGEADELTAPQGNDSKPAKADASETPGSENGQANGSDAAGETGQANGSDAAGENGQTSASDAAGENGQTSASDATEETGQTDISETESGGNGDGSESPETGNETETGEEEAELPSEDNQEGSVDELILDDTALQVSEEDGLVASGITNNISWKIDKDEKLALEGSGDYALDGEGKTPWAAYSENIKSAEVNITGLTSAKNMFSDCYYLINLDLSCFDTNNVTDMSGMFSGCNIRNLDLSCLNTSQVTDMSRMFEGSEFDSLDLSSFDTKNVTDMSWMFAGCFDLENLDLSGFDTKNVTDMSGMFIDCHNLRNLDLSSFNTSQVTDMSRMFEGSGFDRLDLSSFDTNNVTNMSGMFSLCWELRNLDLSSFNTGKVTDMSRMFTECDFDSLDLSGFDTANVTNMEGMFSGCTRPRDLDLSSFDMGKVNSADEMLPDGLFHILTPKNCNISIQLPTPYSYDGTETAWKWYQDADTVHTTLPIGLDHSIELYLYENGYTGDVLDSGVTNNISWKIDKDRKLTITGTGDYETDSEGLPPWAGRDYIRYAVVEVSEITSAKNMFNGCYDLRSIDLSKLDTSQVTDMSGMFQDCGVTSLDLSKFDTGKVTDMSHMFSFFEGSKLTSLDLSSFDTSQVKDMSSMFYWCWSLKSLNISSFDTSNVTNMSEMFYYCSILKNLDLSNFNTSKVTDMSGMFYTCNSLSKLDLSSFDTGNVTNMSNMFACWNLISESQLTDLDISSFNTSKVTDMSEMFGQCANLKKLDLSNFDTNKVTNMHNMLSGANSLVYIRTPKNCNLDVPLPVGDDAEKWYDGIDNVCTALPVASSESIELYKNGYPGDGTIKRMAYISGISIKDKVYDGEPAAYAGTAAVKDTDGNAIDIPATYSYTGKLADGSAYAQAAQAPIQAGKYTLTVTAENDTYMGQMTYSFNIFPKEISISADSVSIRTGGQLPALSELTYKVNGMLGDDGLITQPKLKYSAENISSATAGSYDIIPYGADAGNNYSIKYVNGTLAIEAGKPSYADKDDSSYTDDERIDLGSESLNAAIANIKAKVYDGSEYEPALKVTATVNGKKKTLVEGTDYRVIYENNINAGTGTANVWGNGIYKGKISKTFTIKEKLVKKLKVITGNVPGNISADSIADTSVALPVYIYDGIRLLTRGEDYNLSLKTSNAKALTLTVTGAEGSNYTGTGTAKLAIYDSANAEKVINPENVIIDGKTFNEGYETAYTGKALKPAVTVKVGDTMLTSRNYKVAYQNNKDAGTAYVIVTGKGEYKGKAVVPFSIASIQPQLTITNTIKDKTYNGKLQKPSVTVKAGNVKLKKNKDYTVSYTENLHAGTATVIVTGKGNYIGSVEKEFKISKQNINKVSIKGTQKDGLDVYYGTRLLRKDSDYTLEYGVSKGKNKMEVTITAKENSDFAGSVTKSVKMQ